MEGPDDTFKIHLNAAMQHIKLAKWNEQQDKYEVAYKHYLEASSKLMGLLRAEQDAKRKEIFVKHMNECITNAGFLKTIIQDKKNSFARDQISKLKPSDQPVGMKCLGSQFMFAFDFYKGLGDHYF